MFPYFLFYLLEHALWEFPENARVRSKLLDTLIFEHILVLFSHLSRYEILG